MKNNNLLKVMMASSLLLLASCGNDNNSQSSTNASNSQTSNQETTSKVKVGLGYDVTFSFDTETNVAEVSVATAFTTFDTTTNKVVANRIDVSQVKVVANEAKDGLELKEGTLKREDGYVKTKLELGADYGMFSAWGSQLAEIDTQIESYASWTVGKTVQEIIDGANDETLKASCTVGTSQFSKAISNAYTNVSSVEYTNSTTNKAGIAINAFISEKTDLVFDVAGALVDSSSKVVADAVDSIVVSTKLADNVISVDTSKNYHKGSTETEIKYLSKKTLKYDYNMKLYAGCALEWFEQIASLENTAVGKTAAEIGSLVKDDGSDNANIISGATINVTSYVAALKRAAEYANVKPIGPQH